MLSLVARLCNKEKAVSSQAGRNLQLARRCCPLFFTTISTQLPSRTLVLPSLTSLCPMSARAPQSHVLSQVPLRRLSCERLFPQPFREMELFVTPYFCKIATLVGDSAGRMLQALPRALHMTVVVYLTWSNCVIPIL